MAPPQLTADTPVLEVRHPMVVNLDPTFRKKPHATLGNYSFGFRLFWIAQEPLLAQTRLDRHVGALAVADVVYIGFLLLQKTERLQLVRRDLPRLKTIQATQVCTSQLIHDAVGVHDVDRSQPV